jgi:quercetin dioxygenase-like cupin family protein
MDSGEIEKSKVHDTKTIIDYVPNSACSKTIITRTTGSIRVMSFDTGVGLSATISPFDSFAQIIEGKAEFVIDGTPILIETGQSIIIPAHKSNLIKANGRFKMILTVIKSGYEMPIGQII